MERKYSIPVIGAEVTARLAKEPGVMEFYGKERLIATYDFRSSTLVYDKSKAMGNEANLELCQLICRFASEMIFGKQFAVGVSDGISNKPQRNKGIDDYSR